MTATLADFRKICCQESLDDFHSTDNW